MKYCISLILLLSSLFFHVVYGQERSISFSAGAGPLTVQYNAQFEQQLSKYEGALKSIHGNFILGALGVVNLDTRILERAVYFGPGVNTLFFSDKNSFELGLKLIYGTFRDRDDFFFTGIHLGYRYTGSEYIFRIGLGVPELIYIGAGIRF